MEGEEYRRKEGRDDEEEEERVEVKYGIYKDGREKRGRREGRRKGN